MSKAQQHNSIEGQISYNKELRKKLNSLIQELRTDSVNCKNHEAKEAILRIIIDKQELINSLEEIHELLLQEV